MIIKDLGAVSAYAYAVEKGYTGTEAEFATLMASYATVAEEAAESAESASASATSASASASTATTKASEASTAAQTATAKAEEAQADADAAALDASQALSAASTATSKASEAAQSASDAVTAKTAAQTAQTAAESSATTAQTAAQTATAKAAEAAESARTLTIDATLTQSGQAADAAETGKIKNGLSNVNDLLNIAGDSKSSVLNVTSNQYYTIFENVELKANVEYIITFDFSEVVTVQSSYGAIRKTDGSGNYGAVSLYNKDNATITYTPDSDITCDIAVLIPVAGDYSLVCSWAKTSPDFVEATTDSLNKIDSFISAVKAYDQVGNVYQARTDELTGRYYYRGNSTLKTGSNAGYNGFIIPVLKNTVYTCSMSNVLFLDESKQLLYPDGTGNNDLQGARTFYSGNALYVAMSYATSWIPTEGVAVSKGDYLDYGTYALKTYALPLPKKNVLKHITLTQGIESGNSIAFLGESGVRDGEAIVFKGSFQAFSELDIKFTGTNVTNAVTVTEDNLIIVNGVTNTVTQSHGLTIDNDISVLLEFKSGKLYVSISSCGEIYKYDCLWDWTASRMSGCEAKAVNMAFTSAKFTVTYPAAQRNIWYFGDSYAAFNTDARLPYYMVQYGYDKNVLFNSVSGSSTAAANIALTTLLPFGNPEYAICASGMNDGSDTDNSTPNATWLTRIQTFIDTCKNHSIIPVLCTVPTIATVNNNAKNTWVKSSGERYIDFAGAVGADENGQWYTGMISQDGIHPSALGAVAQFMQLLTDMPEVIGG